MSVRTRADIMGMPVSVHIVDACAREEDAESVFASLRCVDRVFSTYRRDSETERINRDELSITASSAAMQTVIALCEQTRLETGGYFNARYRGRFDPSGIVKGYAIRQASELLRQRGFRDFFVEAGGDIQTSGRNDRGEQWRVGIRNPFDVSGLINVVHLSGDAIATSGTYERGEHIYDPVHGRPANAVASLSVIAANVYDADRFATAAFAMGERGIFFIEATPGLEGCVIDWDRRAFCTTGFHKYLSP
jgi:thiamine biosynthesis lipoprotein